MINICFKNFPLLLCAEWTRGAGVEAERAMRLLTVQFRKGGVLPPTVVVAIQESGPNLDTLWV